MKGLECISSFWETGSASASSIAYVDSQYKCRPPLAGEAKAITLPEWGG